MRVVQRVWGKIPEEIEPCLASVEKAYPQVELMKSAACDFPLYESDKWCWQMFLENDDIMCLNWDVLLDGALNLARNGLPSAMFLDGQPDNCLIYSPDRSIFAAFDAQRKKRNISFETKAWFRKVFRDQPFNEIVGPEHLRFSGFDGLAAERNGLRAEDTLGELCKRRTQEDSLECPKIQEHERNSPGS